MGFAFVLGFLPSFLSVSTMVVLSFKNRTLHSFRRENLQGWGEKKKKVCLVKSSVFTLTISPGFSWPSGVKVSSILFFSSFFLFFFFSPLLSPEILSLRNLISSDRSCLRQETGEEQGSKLSTWEQISIGRHCANNRDFHRFIDLIYSAESIFFFEFSREYIYYNVLFLPSSWSRGVQIFLDLLGASYY